MEKLSVSHTVVLILFWFVYEALVESLVNKTQAWEKNHGTTFTYDGVPLLAMLDEYMMLRHDREDQKRRLRVNPHYPNLTF